MTPAAATAPAAGASIGRPSPVGRSTAVEPEPRAGGDAGASRQTQEGDVRPRNTGSGVVGASIAATAGDEGWASTIVAASQQAEAQAPAVQHSIAEASFVDARASGAAHAVPAIAARAISQVRM